MLLNGKCRAFRPATLLALLRKCSGSADLVVIGVKADVD